MLRNSVDLIACDFACFIHQQHLINGIFFKETINQDTVIFFHDFCFEFCWQQFTCFFCSYFHFGRFGFNQTAQYNTFAQLNGFSCIVQWQFFRTIEISRYVQLQLQLIVHQFSSDRVKGIGVFLALYRVHGIHNCKTIARLAIFIANTAGMYHVMSFIIIFYITDIWGEEFSAPFFPVLPNLLNLHFFSVDSIPYAAGKVFMVWNPFFWIFGTEMSVVKQHNISVRQYHTSMLFILPVKFVQIPYWFEEIFLHVFRPHFWVP